MLWGGGHSCNNSGGNIETDSSKKHEWTEFHGLPWCVESDTAPVEPLHFPSLLRAASGFETIRRNLKDTGHCLARLVSVVFVSNFPLKQQIHTIKMLSSTFLTLALATAAFSHPTKRQTGGVITSCTVPNTAALTFDDGPYIYSQNIVDMLDAKGVKGTFFVSTYHIDFAFELAGSNPNSNCSDGNNYGCIYGDTERAALQNAYSKGHQIASHTWAHKDLATLTTDQVESEFTLTDTALEKILGVRVAFMRPPYGSYNDGVLQVAAAHNQSVITWDFDSGDSVGEAPADSEKDYDTLVAKHPSTILTLNHETVETTSTTVLPHALDDLLGAGYNLVTVAECLGLPPYLSVAAPGTQDVRVSPRFFLIDC
ncbi:uncharacterized protein ARMOST_21071 [Armillaria ostoyae]|uniref:NodB homology domain-containing protein n=1 Tax=Armillaria ostoyae TaxID=47428 RepID=A0A284S938_ARMOS|nr:uncharacterized protein ARMOST_21071 [Armillaria ostoyae]